MTVEGTTDLLILSVAAADGAAWAATGESLLSEEEGGWRADGWPEQVARAAAVAAGQGIVLVGSSLGEICLSADAGQTWYAARVDGAASPVTCLALSPRFAEDGVALAGTERDGALRTADGGRSWHPASVGLGDDTILALAAAPSWAEREFAFTIAADGLYRSPNGGRAWKRLIGACDDAPIQAVACCATSGGLAVITGAEDGALWRSADAGATWEQVARLLDGAINCLWRDRSGGLVAGASSGLLLRSADAGATWRQIGSLPHPVLAIADDAGRLLVGTTAGVFELAHSA